jgi:3',5'-cyclic-nucleotide phosphodiesterase
MKFKVLGCFGGNVPGLGMTSFLVDDAVCLDAGWLVDSLTLEEQVKVRDVFISHSHLDHTCSLPFLIDNNFAAPGYSLRIYAIRETVRWMKKHLFNNETWPDFTRLPTKATPVVTLVELQDEVPVSVLGKKIRAVRVSHSVPTAGFIVEDERVALAFSSDTGPTKRFWKLCNDNRKLRAVITEVSFPDEQQTLADISGHLTPRTLAGEVKKLKRDVPIYIYGRKPRFAAVIGKQMKNFPDKRVKLLLQGRTYTV